MKIKSLMPSWLLSILLLASAVVAETTCYYNITVGCPMSYSYAIVDEPYDWHVSCYKINTAQTPGNYLEALAIPGNGPQERWCNNALVSQTFICFYDCTAYDYHGNAHTFVDYKLKTRNVVDTTIAQCEDCKKYN